MRKYIYSLLVFISFIAVFYIVYSPAINNRYLFFDDYLWVWTSHKDSALKDALMTGTMEGRALFGIFVGPAFEYINYHKSLDAAIPIRFVILIGITLLAYIIFTVFRTNRFKTDHAYLLSIAICTLPSYSVYISWLLSIGHSYAAAFSALASLIMCNIISRESQGDCSWPIMHVLMAATCLIIALLIYQPAAMLYWSLALIPILMYDEQYSKKKMAAAISPVFYRWFIINSNILGSYESYYFVNWQWVVGERRIDTSFGYPL